MKAVLGALMALALAAGPAAAGLPRTPQPEIDAMARVAAHGDTLLYGILQRTWSTVADVEAGWIFKDDALAIVAGYRLGQTRIEDVRGTFSQPCNCHVSSESEMAGGILALTIGDSGGIFGGPAVPVAILGFQNGTLASKTVVR